MGEYLVVGVAVLEHEGDEFVQHGEIIRFDQMVEVHWCRTPRRPPGPDIVSLAYDTLRFRQTSYWREPLQEAAPVIAVNGNLTYAYQFHIGAIRALYHLVLPPSYLPDLEAIRPWPLYIRPQGGRLVMDWLWRPSLQFVFPLSLVENNDFEARARRLEANVIQKQPPPPDETEDFESLLTQARLWQSAQVSLQTEPDVDNRRIYAQAQSSGVQRAALRRLMLDHLSDNDVKNLAFDLNIDYEQLPAQEKSGRIRELLQTVERQGRRAELIAQLRRERHLTYLMNEIGLP